MPNNPKGMMATVLAYKKGDVKLDDIPKGLQGQVQRLASAISKEEEGAFGEKPAKRNRIGLTDGKPTYRTTRSF